MSFLNRKAVAEVAHRLYASAFSSEFMEAGGRLTQDCLGPNGVTEDDRVARLDEANHAPIIWELIGRLHQAWGHDPALVFHHMFKYLQQNYPSYAAKFQGEAGFQEAALFRTLMACQGHGISLTDDTETSDAWDALKDVLWKYADQPDDNPFHYEETQWREMAQAAIGMRTGYVRRYMKLPPKLVKHETNR
jgi:hypothetical protein